MPHDPALSEDLIRMRKVITGCGDDEVVSAFAMLLISTNLLYHDGQNSHLKSLITSSELTPQNRSAILERVACKGSNYYIDAKAPKITHRVGVTGDLIWTMLRRPAQLRWMAGWLNNRGIGIRVSDKEEAAKLLAHVTLKRVKLPQAVQVQPAQQSWVTQHKQWYLDHRKRSLDYLITCLSETAG